MESAIAARAHPGKYLTLQVGAETYAVEVSRIREILGLIPITSVPKMPGFVKGVINLRGRILPVIDLRIKFGMAQREFVRETCIVIVEIKGAQEQLWIGVIVDAVCDVLYLSRDEIEAVPSFGSRVDTSFLLGMSRSKDTVKLLLDIEQVLTAEEVIALATADEAKGAEESSALDGSAASAESTHSMDSNESAEPTEPAALDSEAEAL